MARVDTLDHFLADIATAIKTAMNNNSTIYPADFDTLILNLSSLTTQSKTVNPSIHSQTITPDVNYSALSSVTVNAVTSSIDNGIQPSNIKRGVSILGVSGTIDATLDTSDATATEADILSGKTAYVDGIKLTGTYSSSGFVVPDGMKFAYSDLINIPQLDTSNVTNMDYMFSNCHNITTIPLLNTSNVVSMMYMFDNSSITTIPLIDASSVMDMGAMFSSCYNLTSIPLIDTSSVQSMTGMFEDCLSLTTIPLIDTSSVIDMSYMFNNCTALISIPSLDTSSAVNMENMFKGCNSLTTVPILDMSSLDNTDYDVLENTFVNCNSLSNQSLDNILASCLTCPFTYTLEGLGLSPSQINTCHSLSNYTDLILAGWQDS